MVKILLASALCTVAFAATVVVPNANTGVAGNDTSGMIPTSPIAGRFQSVINPGQLPTGPISITGFTWRAKPGTGALNVAISGTVSLSTTSKFANSSPGPLISTTFASNVGLDNTLVATLSGFSMTAAGCAVVGTTPCPFANDIVFTTPFSYNAANGALLADLSFTSFSSSVNSQFDVQDCAVATCTDNGVFVTPLAATGALNNSNNVTRITYTAVPTTPIPPSILITMLGLACVGFYVGRRGGAKLA